MITAGADLVIQSCCNYRWYSLFTIYPWNILNISMGLDQCLIFYINSFWIFFAREVTVILPAREFPDFPISERHVDWWNIQEIHEDLKKVILTALEQYSQLGLGLQQTSSFVHQCNSILTYSCWSRNSGIGCFETHLNFPLKDRQSTQYFPNIFFTLLNCQSSICPHTLVCMALSGSDSYRALVHPHMAQSAARKRQLSSNTWCQRRRIL